MTTPAATDLRGLLVVDLGTQYAWAEIAGAGYSPPFAAMALAVQFVLKTLGTVVPELFRVLIVAQATQVISVLAGIVIIVFFILLYRDCQREGREKLKMASMLGIIGSCIGLLTTLKGFILVFQTVFSPHMVRSIMTAHYFETVLPWISSALFLFFIIVFWEEMRLPEQTKLRRAALVAVFGAAFVALAATLVVVNYLIAREVTFLSDLIASASVIILLLLALSALAVIYFFLVYYREQTG